ncbi:FAD-dependent 5-carboxymethylaminomethyl-2-thiouridine(34) oxidoreductase MnmC [Shewanella sp. SR44-3]|nr:FAD-dependent 5-carboxymethylaminomethyl-2-thiouridine(34) oxidoreductase MnmC [Shewanella sp. SR44-3]
MQSDDACLTLGQIGLGNGVSMLMLWQSLAQYIDRINAEPISKKQTKSLSAKVQLVIFEPNAISALELKQYWQALGLLSANSPVMAQAEQFIAGEVARINGAQRFIFEQGQLCIDVHFGELQANLSQLITPKRKVDHWHCLPHITNALTQAQLWQMGRLSKDGASLYLDDKSIYLSNNGNQALAESRLIIMAEQAGFSHYQQHPQQTLNSDNLIALAERSALRQQQINQLAHSPIANGMDGKHLDQPIIKNAPEGDATTVDTNSIAIIGGGIAGACLALSLAERGKPITLYCQDDKIADGASGNRQGAIYPLLTPENSPLSQFFQQAFLFSRRRLLSLMNDGYPIGHQLCGVLQTGFDERSDARLNKIVKGQSWPHEIAYTLNPQDATEVAGVSIDKAGFFYPNGGWICPFEFARACLEKAKSLANVEVKLNCTVTAITSTVTNAIAPPTTDTAIPDTLEPKQHTQATLWGLYNGSTMIAQHHQVVLASGASITDFEQTQALQMSGFRGQVSHVPSQGELTQLSTVICANGYLTPAMNSSHCVGASYIKDPKHLDICPDEQRENGQKMQQSFPALRWPQDIDVSDMEARVGVRMVTRDHFPMMGCAPDVTEIINRYDALNTSPLASQNSYAKQCQQYWQQTPAPVHHNLFVLGGLGSRGLSSGPLAAECLAALLCGEIAPISADTLALLNPNRMWMRKLLKGKAL